MKTSSIPTRHSQTMRTSVRKFPLALGLAVAIGLAALPRVASAAQPDKFVRYVESTGSQYIDTGVVGRYGTKAECKVAWLEFGDKAFLDCGDWGNNTRFFLCHCSSNDGHMFLGYRTGGRVHKVYDLMFEPKRVYNYTADISAPDGDGNSTATVTIDGTTADAVVRQSLDTGINLYVFAMNHNGTAYGHSKTRCYGLKIWQIPNGGSTLALVRDFKPCVKSGRAGLYDAVSDTIFYSDSGTDLVYDTNCDVPDAYIDYVESLGNSYVDTGIIGRSGTAAKMEIALMANSDQALLASRDGNNRFYPIHNGGGNQWLYGYGGYTKFGSFEVGRKYYVDSSLAAGSQVISIGEDGPEGATTTYVSNTSATSINTGRSMYLFCCNQSGSALAKQYWGKARVYWLKIFQDGEMVRDFRPCLKYGEAALYDAVSETIFYPTGDPLAFDNSVAADPETMVYVEYIESDGLTHYLDTGVSAESPTRAAGEFSWTRVRTSVQEDQRLGESHRSYLACGYWNSSSDANRFYMVDDIAQQNSQQPWLGYGNNSQAFGSAYVAGTKYAFDVSFAAGEQKFILTPEGGQATTNSNTWAGNATGQGNLYLFACNDAKNKKPIYRSATRCYGLTIWQGGTKVREFKPCVKDGQAALYDTVSQRIFYPAPAIPAEGSAGPITEESTLSPFDAYLEYAESDGTQYIDTEVIGRAKTTVEFVETCLRPASGEYCLVGALGSASNSRFYMWYHGNEATLGLGYDGSYWRPSLSDPATPATQWGAGYEDVYRLNNGDTTHARVSFAAGSQKVTTINDATGTRTVISERTIADNVDTDRNLYVFANDNNGTPAAFSRSRLYWLKIWQDGAPVRKFQPFRLKNGLVGLWDHVGQKAYFPKSAAGDITYFSATGPEAKMMRDSPFLLIVR